LRVELDGQLGDARQRLVEELARSSLSVEEGTRGFRVDMFEGDLLEVLGAFDESAEGDLAFADRSQNGRGMVELFGALELLESGGTISLVLQIHAHESELARGCFFVSGRGRCDGARGDPREAEGEEEREARPVEPDELTREVRLTSAGQSRGTRAHGGHDGPGSATASPYFECPKSEA